MTEEHKILKYGIRDGKEFHISEVESGLKCNCYCPACGEKLIAKKGKSAKPQQHFAHKSKIICEYAYETSIHYDAKRILEKYKEVILPYREPIIDSHNLNNFYRKIYDKSLGKIIPKSYVIDNIVIEKKLHDIVPDLICTIRDKPILIEIAVTHKIKDEKQQKINNIGIPVIEIDLSGLNRTAEERDLLLNVVENICNKTWYGNKKDEELIENVKTKYRNAISRIRQLHESKQIIGSLNNRLIEDCPLMTKISRSTSISLNKCWSCNFNLASHEFNVLCGYKKYNEIKSIIEEINENKT